jgi:hypothetical protein
MDAACTKVGAALIKIEKISIVDQRCFDFASLRLLFSLFPAQAAVFSKVGFQ